MNRLAVVVLVIGIVILGLETTLLKAEPKSAKPAAKAAAAEQAKPAKNTGKATDANLQPDANEPNEPNEADILAQEFSKASKNADLEYEEAMRQSTENRVKMMTAMQKQTVAELEFIRNLALQEGAVKTAKAVDLAIEKRTARYDEIIQNMKERQERQAERAEREAKREQRGERDHSRRRTRP